MFGCINDATKLCTLFKSEIKKENIYIIQHTLAELCGLYTVYNNSSIPLLYRVAQSLWTEFKRNNMSLDCVHVVEQ